VTFGPGIDLAEARFANTPAKKRPRMKNSSLLSLLIRAALLIIALASACPARAHTCPTSARQDRHGSPGRDEFESGGSAAQSAGGERHRFGSPPCSDSIDTSNTRFRTVIAHCTEF
jgi:hypothetical protein